MTLFFFRLVLAISLLPMTILAQTAPQADIAKLQAQTTANPKDANAWENLGLAYHAAGDSQQAIAAFNKALDLGYPPPTGKYNLACAYAKSGTAEGKQQAITLLKAVVSGNGAAAFIPENDSDFTSLKDDPGFKEVVKASQAARVPPAPCMDAAAHPEYRKLDFWVGEWDVFNKIGQQKVGTSSVQLILKNCVVFENWSGLGGSQGKSFNKYDPTLKKWEQFWVADTGGTTHYTGAPSENQMNYLAESIAANGTKFLRRLTFTKLDENTVRQFEEISTDEGKTWSVGYDFTYRRSKERQAAMAQKGN